MLLASLCALFAPCLQCGDWVHDFDAPGPGSTIGGEVRALAVYDDASGSGTALYLGVNSTNGAGVNEGKVVRWNSGSFTALPFVSLASIDALAVFDDGNGPALYAGGSTNSPTLHGHLWRWNGATWSLVAFGTGDTVQSLCVFDDGSGPALYVGGIFVTAGQGGSLVCNGIARWNGAAWSALSTGMQNTSPSGPAFSVSALAVFDDGSGPALHAGGRFTSAGGVSALNIARWNGSTWSAVGGGITSSAPSVMALLAHDEGGGARSLFAGGTFSSVGGQPISTVARWNGTGWSALGAFDTSLATVSALCEYDDGSGSGREVFASGAFNSLDGVAARNIARWDGSAWSALGLGLWSTPPAYQVVSSLAVHDDASGRGPLLFAGGAFAFAGGNPTSNIAAFEGCHITSFCAGDGFDPAVTTICPCNNFGASGHGCAWHNGPEGALLAAGGRIAPSDTLVLQASGMPASAPSTIFLKGDESLAQGVVFGDGVRCAGGNLIRLGSKLNVNGAAQYPEAGNASVSVRGMTPVGSGSIGYYQTYYRNAASFCTSATFNVTNAIRIVW